MYRAWNKELRKETDSRVLQISKKISTTIVKRLESIGDVFGCCKRKYNKCFCKRCGKHIRPTNKLGYCKVCMYTSREFSNIMSRVSKGKNGGIRSGSTKNYKGGWYLSKFAGNIYLDSSWEIAYAIYLDRSNICWIRPNKGFVYMWKDKKCKYYPDFYLVDTDEYIEIKNFITDIDRIKWKSFPNKLTVLLKQDLIKLGLINKYGVKIINASEDKESSRCTVTAEI